MVSKRSGLRSAVQTQKVDVKEPQGGRTDRAMKTINAQLVGEN